MSYFLATTLALNLLGAVALCYAAYSDTEEGAEPAFYFGLASMSINSVSLMHVFFNIL